MGKKRKYMNKTFCPFYEECENGEECKRALTPDIRIEAEREGAEVEEYDTEPVCFEAWAVDEDDMYDSWYDYELEDEEYEDWEDWED